MDDNQVDVYHLTRTKFERRKIKEALFIEQMFQINRENI